MNVLYHHRTRAEEVEGVHIRGMVQALRELGHQVDIVSPPGVDAERAAAPTTSRRPARRSPWSLLTRQAPESLFEAIEAGYNGYAWPLLERRLGRGDYGMLYERYALFSIGGVLAARRHRVPLVLEVNDSAVVHRIRALHLRGAARRVERFVFGSADAIITITDFFRDLIVQSGVPAARVHVFPNAVDRAAFASPPDGAAVRARHQLAGKVVVGYVGAVNQWRRLDLLLSAFAELARDHHTAHLLVVGDGPDRAALGDRAEQIGLAARVSFTGRVAHAEIAAHLGAIDVAVIPHSNTYGSPMKLFEYMAAGCVPVAPWLPPIVEILGDGDGGVLFAPLSTSALAAAIGGLIDDPVRRAALAKRARERALTEYVWQRHAERLLAIHAALPR